MYLAALLNLAAALLVFSFYKKSGSSEPNAVLPKLQLDLPDETLTPYSKIIRTWSAVGIFVSGFSALAYEILWTRFLTLPLLTSIYAFSLMLAVFLIGIAYGSRFSVTSRVTKKRPVAMFGFFEILIGFLTLAGMAIFKWFGQNNGFLQGYAHGIVATVLVVFPVAFVFGWQLPVAIRCCLADSTKPGKGTGWAYAVNTTGAILGSIIATFLMIPSLGTARSFSVLAAINMVIGIALILLAPRDERKRLPAAAFLLVILSAAMVMLAGNPYEAVMQARVTRIMGKDAKIYAFFEGVAGTTVPAGDANNRLNRHLFINGYGMTALLSETKLMAHLPMLLTPDPKKVLVVCFGMGTTVRSAAKHPVEGQGVDITAVDIVPNVFDCFKYFHTDADQILAMPNVHTRADDGRNFLLFQNDRYDVITIDPAPPLHSAGTVNLYTKEFFDLCKSKITPNGVVCLWVPPAPASESLMIMRSFADTFPKAVLWGAFDYSGFYLIGGHRSLDQTETSLEVLAKKLSQIADMSEWDKRYGDPAILKNLYLMGSEDFQRLVRKIRPVTDNHPYTEFPIWRGVLTGNPPLLSAEVLRNALHKQQ